MTQISKQEQKLIYQALKNSLVESTNINDKLIEIDEMPVFRPTEEEFSSAIDYIEKIYNDENVRNLYGTFKIIPPASFKPPLAFDINSNTKLPTHYQVLQKLSQGKPFSQNFAGYTFREFKEMAEEIEKGDDHIDWSNDTDIYMHVEKQYWELVNNNQGSEWKIEYASNLDAYKYGSGFGCPNQKIIHAEQPDYLNHNWNLANF